MVALSLVPAVVDLAREMCASEGWDPDEQVEYDPDQMIASDASGPPLCRRWELYAAAASRSLNGRGDWDTF
jgi:hypothetical protein